MTVKVSSLFKPCRKAFPDFNSRFFLLFIPSTNQHYKIESAKTDAASSLNFVIYLFVYLFIYYLIN